MQGKILQTGLRKASPLRFPLACEEKQILLKEEHSDTLALPLNQTTEYKKEPMAVNGVQEVQGSDFLLRKVCFLAFQKSSD